MRNRWSATVAAASLLTLTALLPRATASNGTHASSSADGNRLVRRQGGVGDWFQREAAPWLQQHEFREADEVALIPVGRPIPTSYNVPMKVGTFDVQLLLDTGLPDTWVMDSSLAAKTTARKPVADERPESTFVADGATFTVEYAAGIDVHVSTGLAWLRLPKHRAVRHNVGVARRFGGRPFTYAFDGVLGLNPALPFDSAYVESFAPKGPLVPFAERVVAGRRDRQRVFTVSLRADVDDDDDNKRSGGQTAPQQQQQLPPKRRRTSYLSIGTIKRERYAGELAWVKVLPRKQASYNGRYYELFSIRVSGIGVGGARPAFIPTANVVTVFDTGSPTLSLAEAAVKAYAARAQGKMLGPNVPAPCKAKLPPLRIVVRADTGRDHDIVIPGVLLLGSQVSAGSNMCKLKLSATYGAEDQLLGVQLFQARFVAFDWGNGRVGFAKHADAA